jgi:hypothetical protein
MHGGLVGATHVQRLSPTEQLRLTMELQDEVAKLVEPRTLSSAVAGATAFEQQDGGHSDVA